MKKRSALGFALLTSLCLVLSGVGHAGKDKEGDNGKEEDAHKAKITDSVKSVKAINTAIELIQMGRDKKSPSPEALLMAAKILHENKTTTNEKVKVEKAGGTKPDKEVKSMILEPKTLVEEALKMPGAKEPYVAVFAKHVKEILEQESKGAFPSPISYNGTINPKQEIFYFVTFKGGELASVSVLSPDGVDLDLYIYPQGSNQVIVKDSSALPNAFVTWYVPNTQVYKIKVLNFSSSNMGNYQLFTN